MVYATIITVLKRLAPIIEGTVRDEVNLVLNSQKEAENLACTLKEITKRLVAAENKRVRDDNVKAWLEEIEDAAYEMDDALDEWDTKKLELEIEGSQAQLQEDEVSEFWEKVSSFIQSLCLCCKDFIERRGLALKIKELNGKLKSIKKKYDDKSQLFFPNVTVEKDEDEFKPVPTTAFDVDESEVMGREADKNNLRKLLLSEEDNMKVIAIVGTGGMGKSTLAQLVFHDSEVKKHFPSKTWVCVSDPFDRIKIAKAILESLDGSSPNVTEFQTLLENIESSISGKRFLIVLDDVWTEEEKNWKPLKMSLSKYCGPGSRILVTTRKESVADMMDAKIQPLGRLSDSVCWSLMIHKAFQGGKKWNHEILKSIGWEIARKCDGLPLAAITLGSLLRQKNDVKDWEAILNSDLWQLEIAGEIKIFPFIHLSYNELRPSVKRCFSYCAIYPKDSKIEADTLIKIWMAQGFLSSESTEEMEQMGREYLKDLVSRSFFQDIIKDDLTGQIESFQMHDIIHDFAQYVTKGDCFILKIDDDDKEVSFSNSRHLALINYGSSTHSFSISGVENLKNLRSFIIDYCLPPKDVLGTLKCVRVLSLYYCGLKEVPPEIAKLIHLRYLDLSDNEDIIEVPISLCHLYNLQTLLLHGCAGLSELPKEIYKLINLRHLSFDNALFLPQGVEKLTCLRTLTCFEAKRGGSKLGYLKNLNQLEGSLTIIIEGLNGESDAIEAQNAELRKKTRLGTLSLCDDGEVSMDVLEALEPPPNLSRLKLYGFGVEFPRWISTSLKNLKSLELISLESFPPIGNLPSLENLRIKKLRDTKYRGCEFLRITDGGEAAFPKLKMLEFYACNWTEWEDIREEEENVVSNMPCLRRLRIRYCQQLKSLPHRLLRKSPLEYLNVAGSDYLTEQYKNGKLRDEFLSPTCIVTDEWNNWG